MPIESSSYETMRQRTEAAINRARAKRGVNIDVAAPLMTAVAMLPNKRVRQSAKPLMNKLELAFYEELKERFDYSGDVEIICQGMKLKIANGCWLTVDFVVVCGGLVTCYETKGPHAWDDSIVKLKVAAGIHKKFDWFLVSRVKGQWQEQRILQ